MPANLVTQSLAENEIEFLQVTTEKCDIQRVEGDACHVDYLCSTHFTTFFY